MPGSGLPYENLEWRLVFDRTELSRPAEHVVEAPGFSLRRHPTRDLLVMKLTEKRDSRHAARLPPRGITPPAGLNATVAGWGYTEHDVPSTQLLKVTTPVIAAELCDVPYPVNPRGSEVFPPLCAGLPGKGPRAGDSGGPLFTQDAVTGEFTVIGVVNGGRLGFAPKYVNLADPALWDQMPSP